MKKILIFTVLASLILFSFSIVYAAPQTFAQEDDNPTSLKPDCDPASGDLMSGSSGCGLDDFENLLKTIIKYLTIIIIPIAVGVIIYGGLVIMTAAGNEERVSHAKKLMTTALWGIAIALGSYLIINSIFLALTGKDAQKNINEVQSDN